MSRNTALTIPATLFLNGINRFIEKIRTILLPEIKDLLDSIKPNIINQSNYKTNIKKWLSPIIDLTDFYVYPMNGITEAINWWIKQEKRGIFKDEGKNISVYDVMKGEK